MLEKPHGDRNNLNQRSRIHTTYKRQIKAREKTYRSSSILSGIVIEQDAVSRATGASSYMHIKKMPEALTDLSPKGK